MFKNILYLLVFTKIFFIQVAKSCDYPTAVWCDDDQIAQKCGVQDACTKYKQEIKGQKIRLTLLYETLCPDCQDLIREQWASQYWKFLTKFVKFEFVPYGNAQKSVDKQGRVTFTCQHGPVECVLNKLHSCVQKYMHFDQDRFYPFLYCMEDALSTKTDPDKATQMCFQKARIAKDDQRHILQCRDGPEGEKLQSKMADRTDSIWPEKHYFVPWILVNNVSTFSLQLHQQGINAYLCHWYQGDDKPKECDSFLDNKNSVHFKPLVN